MAEHGKIDVSGDLRAAWETLRRASAGGDARAAEKLYAINEKYGYLWKSDEEAIAGVAVAYAGMPAGAAKLAMMLDLSLAHTLWRGRMGFPMSKTEELLWRTLEESGRCEGKRVSAALRALGDRCELVVAEAEKGG
ncbi:MAG: hypothetical protein V1929_09095 [bacterium]